MNPLSAIGDQERTTLILNQLRSGVLQPDAARDLTEIGQEAVPLLITALNGSDPIAQHNAAWVLRSIRPEVVTEELTQVLIKALSYPDAETRQHVARLIRLLELNSPEIIAALSRAKEDPDRLVQYHESQALKNLLADVLQE